MEIDETSRKVHNEKPTEHVDLKGLIKDENCYIKKLCNSVKNHLFSCLVSVD